MKISTKFAFAAAATATFLQLAPYSLQAQSGDAPQQAIDSAKAQVQRDGTQKEKEAAKSALAKYAVPDIPALEFLGGSSAEIGRPITPKDFALSLADAIDEKGRAKQGFSIEASPYAIFPGFGIQVGGGRPDFFTKLLSNTLLSVATAQVADDTTSTDVGIGLRIVLLDDGDPLRDQEFRNQLSKAYAQCMPKGPPQGVPRVGEPQIVTSSLQEDLKKRREAALTCMDREGTALSTEYAKAHWNARRLIVAVAGGLRLPESQFKNQKDLGNRSWGLYSTPLGRQAQLIAYADTRKVITADTVKAHRAWQYGGRLNVGSNSLNGFAELIGERRTGLSEGQSKSGRKWSVGIEFLATEGLWVSTGFGERGQESFEPDRIVVAANIRWGISKKPWISPQQ